MLTASNLKEFSFKELKMATGNFCPDARLGDGDSYKVYEEACLGDRVSSKVYVGWLDEKTLAPSKTEDGMAVAIKEYPKREQHFELWQNYNAKLSNFSLARLGPSSEEVPVSTVIAGTSGYIAPECFTTGKLYLKSDVYSFGVVLLELLMGLKVNDPEHPCGEQNLVDWLKSILSQERKLKNIMDTQIEGQYPSRAALQAAQLSLRCLELDPRSRPSMKEVVELLKEIEALASHLHEEVK
ncbi:hypothetical protein QYF36_013267 [Acer negundo]|nr:hypothetical protein QYF36_013267 [Acer negundo]